MKKGGIKSSQNSRFDNVLTCTLKKNFLFTNELICHSVFCVFYESANINVSGFANKLFIF